MVCLRNTPRRLLHADHVLVNLFPVSGSILACTRRAQSQTHMDSDFPAAYFVERSIGFTFPDVDRHAFALLRGDADVALGVCVLLEGLVFIMLGYE